jgi:protein tyrosine/serine phosphatase
MTTKLVFSFVILLTVLNIFFDSPAPPTYTPKPKKTITHKDTTKPFIRISNLPKNFDTVPGGNNVYRSSQPSLEQLQRILKEYNIQTVIRMNAKESTNVTPEQEKQLVQQMGKKYVWFNAHMGYQKGKGYVTSLDSIQPYLRKGNVLIHCTHGADRTGYQVAKYVQDKLGWTRQQLWYYTIKYNNWNNNIRHGQTGYIKYMEAFYPYDLWLKEIK